MKLVVCTVVSSLFGLFLPGHMSAQQTAPAMPMQARYEDGAEFRWLHKKVLDSRLLDDMTSPWVAVVVPDGEMNERAEVTSATTPHK